MGELTKTTNSENEEFGRRLKELRRQRGMTAEQVASIANVATSTYREWENGRAISGNPYLRLTQAFGVSLQVLFGLGDERSHEIFARLEELERLIREIKSRI